MNSLVTHTFFDRCLEQHLAQSQILVTSLYFLGNDFLHLHKDILRFVNISSSLRMERKSCGLMFFSFNWRVTKNQTHTIHQKSAKIYPLKSRHYEKATNLEKISSCFDKTAVFTKKRQNKWEIFSNFCGLLKKAEL